MLRKIFIAVCLLIPAAAQAEWREATSRNFIVYSEAREPQLRSFTEKLEKFDRVLRLIHNVETPPSPNRLRVFLLPSTNAVARMAGAPGSGIAGYYVSAARAVMMVGTHSAATRSIVDAESILLHEYTHHFMHHYFPATYPTWYSEGFAEFWGTTRILAGDVVEVGHPAEHRFRSFNLGVARWLPVSRLLTARSYADVPEVDLLYAEGWLLVRYAWQNPERGRQLQQYLTLINAGTPYEEAMDRTFGEGAQQLNSELYQYAGRRRFDVIRLPFRALDPGEIGVRTLGPAEQALITYEIRLSQGVPQQDFDQFASDLRGQARRFPDDPFALRLLTEVERIARDNEAALRAVERLLQISPDDPRGLMHKAMLDIEALRAADVADAGRWNAARDLIRRAHRLQPSDPLPLEALYDSYVAQGIPPPVEGQNALFAALDLAPSDGNLRYKLASDFEQRDLIADAIAIIRPQAYRAPHQSDESERQRQRRERLEDRYRRAGTTRRESARDMLARLEARLDEGGEPAAAADAAAEASPGGSGR